MIAIRIAWAGLFTLLAWSATAAGRPLELSESAEGVVTPAADTQGLKPSWVRAQRGPELQFTDFPGSRLVLKPWEAGRVTAEVSLGIPASNELDGHRLSWTASPLRQEFEVTTSGIAWSLELNWKSPVPAEEGPAYIDFLLERQGVEFQFDGGRLLLEAAGTGDRLAGFREVVVRDAAGVALPTRVSLVEDGFASNRSEYLRVSYEDGEAPRPFRIEARLVGGRTWLEPDVRGSAYGRRIAAAGDVNGDGHADLLVAARFTETSAEDGGRVFLHLGGSEGLAHEAAWTFEGAVPSGQLGADVAGAGDVNGDGFDDLLIGEPGAARVLLFLGRPGGPGAAPDWTFTAGTADLDLGWAVALAGDLDGDGFDDVALGEPRANGAAGLETGRVLLFLGGPDGPGAVADQVIEGGQGFARFGGAVAGAGDVDGDGRAELLVGSPSHDAGADDSGLAQLFHGAPDGVDPSPTLLLEGGATNARCGESLAGLGDLDGDGFADFAAGCPSDRLGRVEVFFGPDLVRRQPLAGAQDGERFGTSIAGGADFDGDGRPELVIGAPGRGDEHGAAVVFTFVGRQLVPQPILTLAGELPITQTGMSVAALGDCDRDGFGELAVGSWYATGALGWAQGRVTVLAGRGWGAAAEPSGLLAGPSANDRFGARPLSAGDLNGDGYGDLLSIARSGPVRDGDVLAHFGGPEGLVGPGDWIPPTVLGGSSVLAAAGVGDVNGDGFDDLLFGAPRASRPASLSGGAALFLGGPDGPSPIANWNYHGDNAGAQEGEAVAPAGDLNGDGYADFLVISWRESIVRVFHGGTPLPAYQPVATFPCGWRCGTGVGDVDGDGFSDLVLISPALRKPTVHFGSPEGATLDGAVTLARIASEVSALGDLNGDGFPEFGLRTAQTSWDIWSGGSRQPGTLTGATAVIANWLEPAGDVDGDGRDDVMLIVDERPERFELRKAVLGGLSTDFAWRRLGEDGPRNSIGEATGFDANGDGLSDLIVGFPPDSTGATGIIEMFPGSGGGGSRRAPVLRRHDGLGSLLGPGRRATLDERLQVEFGLDAPGGREDLRIEWKLDASDATHESSDELDSGPPPGELPAPGLRGSGSFAIEREGLWRPRYRLSGARPVPWTSPWYRLPRLGGATELRVASNRAPICGFIVEAVGSNQLLLSSEATDPDSGEIELSWDVSGCPSLVEVDEDPVAGTALLTFEDCSGTCEVALTAEDAPGLRTSCSSQVSWSSMGTSAGPDRTLLCSQSSVVLAGAAPLADPAHGLLLQWEPAALVSNPNTFTPTTMVPGEYTLTATNPVTGCVESDTVLVLDARDDFEVSVRIEQSLDCLNRSATLVAETSEPGDYSYSWTPRFAVSDPDAATTSTSAEGSFVVEVTSAATGCTITASVTVVDGARAEPSELDRRPDAEPLRVARGASGRLELSWEDTGSRDWSVFRGSLRSLGEDRAYDHASVGACHLDRAEASVSIPPVDSYYLVATDCGAAPAFGRDSSGTDRPPALTPCP